MRTTKIEQFAKDVMGLELTKAQVEMLKWASEGKTIIRARAIGLTTARNVAQAWLKHGLEPAIPTDKEQKP